MKLDVILRTCQRSEFETKSSHGLTRICGADRKRMIYTCLMSLINTLNRVDVNSKLTVLDDNSDKDFIENLKIILNRCNKPTEIVSLEKSGPNNSAYEQFYRASQCEDLVYSVEDDYLHDPDAIASILSAYFYFKQKHPNSDVTIFPFDCPFRYAPGTEATTVLYYDGRRYWREVTKTSNTFLCSSEQLKKHFDVYSKLALEYPMVNEDHTINRLYFNRDSGTGSIRVYNPIPSCAYHLSYQEPAQIHTTHSGWRHLWDTSLYLNLFEGWYNYENFYTTYAESVIQKGHVVEVGSWLGKSTIAMANHNKRLSIKCMIYAVDTWQGSDETKHAETIEDLKTKDSSPYKEFSANLEIYDVEKSIVKIKKTSEEASKDFVDGFADLIIIDAAHDYENVYNDIKNWLPKVRKGGILAGDDYSPSWPGVVEAVNKFFGSDNFQVMGSTWFKIIE